MMKKLSDRELLSILLGEEGESYSMRSLPELFGLRTMRHTKPIGVAEEVLTYAMPDRLMAARELLRRALEEDFEESSDSLSSPASVRDYLRLFLGGQEFESFVALWLDAQHRLIAGMELFRGTLTQTSVYPREVVKKGLALNAAAVIFAHNHPSGVAEPSQSDRMLTDALKQALSLVDIRVLDHFIVADITVMSFAERGLI
ncbi:MAG: DNA repair protein RadC [Gallionellaceae bacterium]|nr:DNA repair protein RadC [Gallionellaceae bacterium]